MNKHLPELDFSPESIPLRRSIWLIYFSAVLMAVVLLGQNPLLGAEGEVAEGIRSLLEKRDIFDTGNYRKPELFSQLWLCRVQMLPAYLGGSSEFTWRLFSLIPALLLLGGTMMLANDFFDRQEMCCAGWMLIGSYGFIYWSRSCANFIFLAAWCIWTAVILNRKRGSFFQSMLLGCLIFSGSFWWGLNYILTLPGVLVITYPVWKEKFQLLRFSAALFAGAVISLALSLLLIWQLELPVKANIFRFFHLLKWTLFESYLVTVGIPFASFGGGKALLNLPRLLLPWTLPAFCTLYAMIRYREDLSREQRYLLWGTGLLFLLTGVFPARRWQYQLCQLPFFIVICAGGITGALPEEEKLSHYARLVMKWTAALAGSVAASVFVIWPLWDVIFQTSMPLWIMIGVPAAGLTALGFLIFDTGATSAVEKNSGMNTRQSGWILAWVMLSAALMIGTSVLGQYRTEKNFWIKCGEIIRGDQQTRALFFRGVPDGRALCYMKVAAIPEMVENRQELQEKLRIENAGELLLILRRRNQNELNEILENTGWLTEKNEPVLQEEGKIQFTGKNLRDDDFLLCRIKRK